MRAPRTRQRRALAEVVAIEYAEYEIHCEKSRALGMTGRQQTVAEIAPAIVSRILWDRDGRTDQFPALGRNVGASVATPQFVALVERMLPQWRETVRRVG